DHRVPVLRHHLVVGVVVVAVGAHEARTLRRLGRCTARQAGHLVAALHRGARDVAPKPRRATQDEKPHRRQPSPTRAPRLDPSYARGVGGSTGRRPASRRATRLRWTWSLMPSPESSSSRPTSPEPSTLTPRPVPPTTASPIATRAGTFTPSRARSSPKRADAGS